MFDRITFLEDFCPSGLQTTRASLRNQLLLQNLSPCESLWLTLAFMSLTVLIALTLVLAAISHRGWAGLAVVTISFIVLASIMLQYCSPCGSLDKESRLSCPCTLPALASRQSHCPNEPTTHGDPPLTQNTEDRNSVWLQNILSHC